MTVQSRLAAFSAVGRGNVGHSGHHDRIEGTEVEAGEAGARADGGLYGGGTAL